MVIVREERYFVHKATVQSYRKSLVTYLFSIDRISDIPNIVSRFSDLDIFIEGKIPLSIVEAEFELVVSFFQDDYIWLKIISHIDISAILLYSGINSCARSIHDKDIEVPFVIVCRLIINYIKLMTNAMNIKIAERNGKLCIDFEPIPSYSINKHYIDTIIWTINRILYVFSKKKPIELVLSHRESIRDLSIYNEHFAIPTKLSDRQTYLCYEPTSGEIDWSFFYIEDKIQPSFISPIHSLFIENYSDISYSMQCRHILKTIIGVFDPTREQVAKVLNISISSLQRRLKQEDTTFQDILLDVRKELAHKYLIERDLPPACVVFLLGYKSSSQFFTAFKKWFLVTPKKYKEINGIDLK